MPKCIEKQYVSHSCKFRKIKHLIQLKLRSSQSIIVVSNQFRMLSHSPHLTLHLIHLFFYLLFPFQFAASILIKQFIPYQYAKLFSRVWIEPNIASSLSELLQADLINMKWDLLLTQKFLYVFQGILTLNHQGCSFTQPLNQMVKLLRQNCKFIAQHLSLHFFFQFLWIDTCFFRIGFTSMLGSSKDSLECFFGRECVLIDKPIL